MEAKPQKPSLGRIVHFAPPQECAGPESLDVYAGIITRVHEGDVDAAAPDKVDICTFGPGSVYHQFGIPFSETATPDC